MTKKVQISLTFLLLTLTSLQGGPSVSLFSAPNTLIIQSQIKLPDDLAGNSGFMSEGFDRNLYVYIHDTNTFLVYDSEDKLISRIDDAWSNSLDRNESSSFFPTDFIITRGFRFAAVDPWRACISLWDRSLRQLNPIALDYDIEIRPVSICNGGNNSLFFINRSDNRVWELDRSMDVKPMTYLSSKLPTKNKYIQVRYLVNRNEVILLGSETLEKITLPGNFVKKHDVKSLSPKRFALFGDEIWILGNRIECVNVINLERLYISSIKNEFESITDIIVPYKEILYLLQNRGNYITRMKIVRNSDH